MKEASKKFNELLKDEKLPEKHKKETLKSLNFASLLSNVAELFTSNHVHTNKEIISKLSSNSDDSEKKSK